jgi:hypothetical protein
MMAFQIQAVIVNEPTTDRGVELKMETLWRISCIESQAKFKEL